MFCERSLTYLHTAKYTLGVICLQYDTEGKITTLQCYTW